MFGILHNKVSGREYYTDMNNYIILDGSTGAQNCKRFFGNCKIPLYDGKTMNILNFNSTFSKEFSKIFQRGSMYYDDHKSTMTQTLDLYNGKLTQQERASIKFDHRNTILYEGSYK